MNGLTYIFMSEITDEQARQKAAELILTGKTLEQAELPAELAEAIRKLVSATFGIDVSAKQAEAEKAEEPKPADAAELDRQLNLEAQYFERLDTLKHYGFLTENGETREGDVPVPSYEKALSTFKPEELEIANHFQKPMLLLVPETSFAAKIQALDAHRQRMQQNYTYVDEIFSRTDVSSGKIVGWRAVIVDSAKEMESYEGDILYLEFNKRIENRKAARRPGEKGMDRHRYALLMMEAIRNGDPVDQELCTLLDDDPALSDYGVPVARFSRSCLAVDFDWASPRPLGGNARFRSSVGGRCADFLSFF